MGDDCKDRGQIVARYYTAASHVTCHRPICMYVVFIFSCSRLDSIRLPPCPGTDLPTPGDSCKSCFRICVLSHRDIAPLSNKCFKAAVFLYDVTLVSSRYRNHWQVRHSTTAEKPFLPPTRRSSSSSRRKSSRPSSILSPCGVHAVECQLQTRHLQHGRVRRPITPSCSASSFRMVSTCPLPSSALPSYVLSSRYTPLPSTHPRRQRTRPRR